MTRSALGPVLHPVGHLFEPQCQIRAAPCSLTQYTPFPRHLLLATRKHDVIDTPEIHTYRTFATPPEEDRATTVGNMSDNLMKTGLVVPEICTWIYRQTHRHIAQTDIHSTPLPLHLATSSTDSTLDSRYYFVSLLPVTDFPVCYLFTYMRLFTFAMRVTNCVKM